jgi:hypothetical protein
VLLRKSQAVKAGDFLIACSKSVFAKHYQRDPEVVGRSESEEAIEIDKP